MSHVYIFKVYRLIPAATQPQEPTDMQKRSGILGDPEAPAHWRKLIMFEAHCWFESRLLRSGIF